VPDVLNALGGHHLGLGGHDPGWSALSGHHHGSPGG
jgi:hypothetical protein